MTAEHDSAHAQRIQIIGNFRFQLYFCATRYVRRPLVSTANRSGRGCVASEAPFVVLLTALACYLAAVTVKYAYVLLIVGMRFVLDAVVYVSRVEQLAVAAQP